MEMKSFFIFSVVLLLVSFSVIHINHANGADFINYIVNPARKLLDLPENRIGEGTCSNNFIQVNQGPSASLPSGIPTYTVIVLNACYSGSCSISNIHLSCGWFSSARLINPRIFRRLNYNDCLVNDGQPLAAGESLTFSYANTYPYKLAVSSIVC
uniref:Uncharacterized protein n=1 Tax=Solanum lycopersicum TaxID=4081 RepID=A0A3Q7JJR8_SOLLC